MEKQEEALREALRGFTEARKDQVSGELTWWGWDRVKVKNPSSTLEGVSSGSQLTVCHEQQRHQLATHSQPQNKLRPVASAR